MIGNVGGSIGKWGLDVNARELVLDDDQDTSITASTDDQIDFRIGGSDLVVMAAAQTTFTQNVVVANAAGPALVNEAATTTNPTLIPNKAELDTGIGWASDTLHFVLGGANEAALTTTAFTPGTSDGSALGTASLMWGDLFLASASVINFNNGDVTLTHSANKLTIGGGVFSGMTHTLWVMPHVVTGTGNTANRDSGFGACDIGSASADGDAYFTIPIPTDFVTLSKAVAVTFNGANGNVVRYTISTSFGANGQGIATHTDTGATVDLDTTQDTIHELNFTDALDGIAANDYVGVKVLREGSHANDTAGGDFFVLGIKIEYTT